MPVRLKDIADDLNLSKMTISKVLRGQADVSAATKARVLQRAKELNYRPNITARSLRTGQTFTMGLVVPSIGEMHLSGVAQGIGQIVRPAGYGLVICPAQNDPELEQRQIELLLARQADVLFIVSVQEGSSSLEQLCKEHPMPIIFLNRRFPGTTAGFVGTDEEEVGRLATEHLIASGCKRIAYLRGPRTSVGDLRYSGFRRALSEAGATFHAEMVIDAMGAETAEYKHGYEGAQRLLAGRNRPTGILAYTDMMAVGALDASLARGLKVPEEIAIVGSGNDSKLCQMRVPLSTVEIPAYEIGQRAGRMALRLVSDMNAAGPRNVLVSPKLLVRVSSKR